MMQQKTLSALLQQCVPPIMPTTPCGDKQSSDDYRTEYTRSLQEREFK
jgi:hypothetical protein